MQPTGDVHLGNYLGALKNWVQGQHKCDAFHGIVDLHALTVAEVMPPCRWRQCSSPSGLTRTQPLCLLKVM